MPPEARQLTSCEDQEPSKAIPVTRIFIKADGDLVVTDLWDSVRRMVGVTEEEDLF